MNTFEYEIKVYSDNKNLSYSDTMSEYQRVVHCKLILKKWVYHSAYIWSLHQSI